MEIDTAEFVEQLSELGIEVLRARYNESSRRIVMELPSSEDAASFLNIVAKYVPEGEPLFQRIFGGRANERSWEYFIRPVEVSLEQMGASELSGLNWKPSKRFRLVVYLRFPPEDIPILLELIRDYAGQELSEPS